MRHNFLTHCLIDIASIIRLACNGIGPGNGNGYGIEDGAEELEVRNSVRCWFTLSVMGYTY